MLNASVQFIRGQKIESYDDDGNQQEVWIQSNQIMDAQVDQRGFVEIEHDGKVWLFPIAEVRILKRY